MFSVITGHYRTISLRADRKNLFVIELTAPLHCKRIPDTPTA
uniref:Uncharacterized protein n=1 Tax=Pseudomonas fluorescens (strain SBW25) TaxID=216595 RepID=A0A0G4E5E0_PSEFS|nr:hypothetical protein PQBR55_0031 [Pseudomonas fluorescens SBW25]